MQEESDLEKKRREAEALLQSMGLTTDSPIGKYIYLWVLSLDISELSVLVRYHLHMFFVSKTLILSFAWISFFSQIYYV